MKRIVVALVFIIAAHVCGEEPRAQDLRLIYLEGSEIKTWDTDSGKGAVLAKNATGLQFHPQTRRLLFRTLKEPAAMDREAHVELLTAQKDDVAQASSMVVQKRFRNVTESVFISDLEGTKTRLFSMPQIAHPGCGHIESAIHWILFCDGGKSVLFRYRVVPEGTDPHYYSPLQMRSAIMRIDGTDRVELTQQPIPQLDSGGWNARPGNFSPDGKRSIFSRATHGVGKKDPAKIELREHDARGGGDGREIDRFDLPFGFQLSGRWSPKGDLYAYMIEGLFDKKYEIRVWDGVKARKIAEGSCSLGGTESMALGWSPDGSRRTILPEDEASNELVQVIDVAAGSVTSTFAVGSDPSAPVWLTDSRRLVALDYGACPLGPSHQHRFANCRTRLLLMDSRGKAGDVPVELAATEKLAYAAPIVTPDGKSLLIFTIASEKVPPHKWAEAEDRVYELKTLDLATGKLSAALAGLSFSTLPYVVGVVAK